jgi:hypothetical protein
LRCTAHYFDDVIKRDDQYSRATKGSKALIYKAAFLDFKLVYDSVAGDSLDLRAEILFKNEDNEITPLREGIWHGRHSVEVPLRHGETRSLVIATISQEGDFTTYENQHPREHPLERTIHGDIVDAEVVIWRKYMNQVMPPLRWLIRLSKVGSPTIQQLTEEGLERAPDTAAPVTS